MNLEKARAKLRDISKSTATKHPKTLVAELCDVIKFLLDKTEEIGSNQADDFILQTRKDLKLDVDQWPPPTGASLLPETLPGQPFPTQTERNDNIAEHHSGDEDNV